MSRRLAAVEGGGTTFVVAIAVGEPVPENVVERAEFPTTSPAETLRRCCDWLAKHEYHALGVACFGPLDLHPSSPTYGFIATTPKPGWRNTDVLGPLRAVRPNVPFAFVRSPPADAHGPRASPRSLPCSLAVCSRYGDPLIVRVAVRPSGYRRQRARHRGACPRRRGGPY